jgi:hypothetical protein
MNMRRDDDWVFWRSFTISNEWAKDFQGSCRHRAGHEKDSGDTRQGQVDGGL